MSQLEFGLELGVSAQSPAQKTVVLTAEIWLRYTTGIALCTNNEEAHKPPRVHNRTECQRTIRVVQEIAVLGGQSGRKGGGEGREGEKEEEESRDQSRTRS